MDTPAGFGQQRDTRTPQPSISLPKGGGAIRGIGEKFEANPVTGTGSVTVPITTSPGRANFGPTLSLGYDSGSGNGPFGFGWSLHLPSVTRKTDKGLPHYDDSDVFLVSGAEDLVPLRDEDGQLTETGIDAEHDVHLYRPRVEGLFARIERWTRRADGDVHWRSISRDNVLTVYGKDSESRVANPDDPRQVFQWLICEARDDKGNAVVYGYKAEDGTGCDLNQAHQRNRGALDDKRRTANRYLKRIRYGNRVPLLTEAGRRPRTLPENGADWMFEVVFDYGEHDENAPTPDDTGAWTHRVDAFSSYRSTFEVRTTRLCQRVLMFHHFPDEDGVGDDCLVRSTDFTYTNENIHTFLREVVQSGYRRDPAGGYLKRSLPPLEFTYTTPVVDDTVREIDPQSLENLPVGVDGASYTWADLDGEGVAGILAEDAQAWYYKHNLTPLSGQTARFSPATAVTAKPNRVLAGGQAQLIDLSGDGQLDLVVLEGASPGLYGRDDNGGWLPFQPFKSRLAAPETRHPGTLLADLTGDGHSDILLIEQGTLTWYPSLGPDGFGPAHRTALPFDDESGPRLLFAHGRSSVHLADLSGDGLADLVRIGNGDICYWPNLGYGKFGPKVTMDHSPHFDQPDQFDPARVRLVDIDGTGTTDVIYLHRDGPRGYFNQSGNGWSQGQRFVMPGSVNVVDVSATDLLGNGTACLVWSSPLPGDAGRQMRYLDLMGGRKPHLLVGIVNNLGAETRVSYSPSTKFFLQDKRDGRPWLTRLPFPVQVIERMETYDHLSRNRFVTRYAYHHGHFDAHEREFRGFGMVEQWDSEEISALAGDNIDAASHVPPVQTKTWYHLGARISYGGEHYGDAVLLDTVLPPGLTAEEEREACRALKGSMLRQEVYALDATPQAVHPYSVTEQNFGVRRLQNRVFLVHANEAMTYHFERDPTDPRIEHAITLEVDDFGNALRSSAVAYGRLQPDPSLPTEADRDAQTETLITYAETSMSNVVDEADDHRAPLAFEVRTYQLTGYQPSGPDGRFLPGDVDGSLGRIDSELTFEQEPTGGRQRRLVAHTKTHFRRDDLTGMLPLGQLESLALPGETYTLAFTAGLLERVYVRDGQPLIPAGTLEEGGYVSGDGGSWWAPTGRIHLSPGPDDTAAQEHDYARQHFFLPLRYRDPFQFDMTIRYDSYDLLMAGTTDALGNQTTVQGNDYRVLLPVRVMDRNGNRTHVALDALGMVVGAAMMGKEGEQAGDSLDGFNPDLPEQTDPFQEAILGAATTRMVYDLFAYKRDSQPPVICTLRRETHVADLAPGEKPRIQHKFSYSDGFGREIQTKIQAEPERVDGVPGPPRWIGNGWTIYNNKGLPVRQYEPFFSATHRFEFGVQAGVSSVLFYDPLERVVATLQPNNTYEKVVIGGWEERSWDANDTVLSDPRTDPDIQGYVERYFEAQPGNWQTWHEQRISGALGASEQAAAEKAAAHAATPSTSCFDGLGRAFLTLEDAGSQVLLAQRVERDIQGSERQVRDAAGRIVATYDYDVAGNRIGQSLMDSGRRWLLEDVTGRPIRSWDSRGFSSRTEYDPLRRPLRSFVTGADPADASRERLTERLVYGEQHPDSAARNLRGKAYLHLDQAGAVVTPRRDFKGNLLTATRHLAVEYRQTPFWESVDAVLPTDPLGLLDEAALSAALSQVMEPAAYTSSTTYDAINRPITLTTPHTPQMTPSGMRIAYNEASMLERVEVNLHGSPDWTTIVEGLEYDAKGQRLRIDYGNAVHTTYEFDPLSSMLIGLHTRRDTFPDDCPTPPPADWPGCDVQNIRYTYDPVGNLTHVRDDAQQAIFFRNRRVEPGSEYTYDALYQLIEATGREHLGQVGAAPVPHSPHDAPRVGIAWSANDGNAMGRYLERYTYDEVGNFLTMQHRGSDPAVPGWTRTYEYLEESNRLSATIVGGGLPDQYGYDEHGNMTSMPHLASVQWGYPNELRQTDLGGGGTAYYCYDATGSRVRKVWEKAPGVTEERLYLGGFEIFRRRSGTNVVEREFLHVVDGERRVAMVETRTIDTAGDDPGPAQLTRFQLNDQLGSSCLELDAEARIISYEEYTPYGSTSYQAVREATETPKSYRYAGMERDAETGLSYHGKRYYAPWLGRWTGCDPLGLVDGTCLYQYVSNAPTNLIDPSGQQGVANLWKWRAAQEEVAEAGRAVIESAPVQVAAGISDAAGDVVVGLWESGRDRVVRTVNEVKDNPGILLAGGLPAAVLSSEIKHQSAEVSAKAEAQGGGLRGWYVAVNQQWNPAYGIFEHGDKAIEAAKRGDWRTAAREGTHSGLSVAATVGVAKTGASLTPKPKAPKAPKSRGSGHTDTARPQGKPHSPAPPKTHTPEQKPAVTQTAKAALSPADIVSKMERHVARQNNRVANAIRNGDRKFFRNLGMSEKVINILMNPQHKVFAAQYGNAMERAVARAFRSDADLSGMVIDARNMSGQIFPKPPSGRPLRPDFGFSEGALQGHIVDLTTAGGRAAKMDKYHDRVITLEYNRPKF